MNLKLTNQQKQYIMYLSIFVLGYLMCMYYPVHKRNNNVPMQLLEGFDGDDPECVLIQPCLEDIVTAAGGSCEADNPCSGNTTEGQCIDRLCEWRVHICEGEECCGEGLHWDDGQCQSGEPGNSGNSSNPPSGGSNNTP